MNYKMLEYDKIDISEGIDVNKTNKSKDVCFVIIGTFYNKILAIDHIFVMVAII